MAGWLPACLGSALLTAPHVFFKCGSSYNDVTTYCFDAPDRETDKSIMVVWVSSDSSSGDQIRWVVIKFLKLIDLRRHIVIDRSPENCRYIRVKVSN